VRVNGPRTDPLEVGRIALGARLRDLRHGAGLTLVELAEASAVSVGYLSDLERGRRLPAMEILYRICAAHGALMADVLDGVYPFGATRRPRAVRLPPDGRGRDGRAARRG
jgi:transcriptional regulator with XRE-family HTH domain